MRICRPGLTGACRPAGLPRVPLTAPLLERDDTVGTPELEAPPRRAVVLHRFTVAAGTAERMGYPALALAARTWQHGLERRWGRRPLPVAPAFR
ncbi:MAG TPA: hypothetical protein VFN60_09205 [Acidimicrobiales bacterium]|nr:hypothetical protein [Acidimicrobiales bacterium]